MTRVRRHSTITDPVQLHRLLFRWYNQNKRPLPWRRTGSPYRILLSEVMLQQTQVARVLPKYREFVREFPSLSALAHARRSDVIIAWRGMGYNGRAVRLHRTAQIITRDWNGRIPSDPSLLQTLPGIGKYTAHAIASFAYGGNHAIVETNIARVLKRLFPTDSKRRDEWDLASGLLPQRRCADWNQALMDLGATVCTPLSPSCDACPFQSLCPSAFARPARIRKTKREPSRDGIPNRIYRGRIVEVLRSNGRRMGSPLSKIGPLVKKNFREADRPWLRKLVADLQRDGLVVTVRRKRTTFVTLAG